MTQAADPPDSDPRRLQVGQTPVAFRCQNESRELRKTEKTWAECGVGEMYMNRLIIIYSSVYPSIHQFLSVCLSLIENYYFLPGLIDPLLCGNTSDSGYVYMTGTITVNDGDGNDDMMMCSGAVRRVLHVSAGVETQTTASLATTRSAGLCCLRSDWWLRTSGTTWWCWSVKDLSHTHTLVSLCGVTLSNFETSM